MSTIASADVQGLTKLQNNIQTFVLIVVSIITVWTVYTVPSWKALEIRFSLPLPWGQLPSLAFG